MKRWDVIVEAGKMDCETSVKLTDPLMDSGVGASEGQREKSQESGFWLSPWWYGWRGRLGEGEFGLQWVFWT